MSPSPERVLSREQCREVDRHAIEVLGVPGVVLMENAGRNAAEEIVRRYQAVLATEQLSAAILCGKGNNAGDGFVIARHLLRDGWRPEVYLSAPADGLTGDAAINYAPLPRMGVNCRVLEQDVSIIDAARQWGTGGVIVDALLGTGFEGQVREPLRTIIDALNACRHPRVVAVDVPSGLDADTGDPGGIAVQAALTITFVARKPGLLVPSAASYVGEVIVADIGLPIASSGA